MGVFIMFLSEMPGKNNLSRNHVEALGASW